MCCLVENEDTSSDLASKPKYSTFELHYTIPIHIDFACNSFLSVFSHSPIMLTVAVTAVLKFFQRNIIQNCVLFGNIYIFIIESVFGNYTC